MRLQAYLYKTVSGAITRTFPISGGQLYVNTHNGDELSLNVPVYQLPEADRTTWPSVFEAYANGIAIVDEDMPWEQAVMFAGPIIKTGINAVEEMIKLQAFNVFEILKKLPFPYGFRTADLPKEDEEDIVFSSNTVSGLYGVVLDNVLRPVGAPSTYRIPANLNLPAPSGGSTYEVGVKLTDGRTLAGVLEDIRDEVSYPAVEILFRGRFTSASKTHIGYDVLIGSEPPAGGVTEELKGVTGKINSLPATTFVAENVDGETDGFKFTNYELSKDATMLYNVAGAISVNDKDILRISDKVGLDNPEMPTLYERIELNRALSVAETETASKSLADRGMTLSQSANIQISNDIENHWWGLLGRLIDFMPGRWTAGAGARLRVAGLTYNLADPAMNIELEVQTPQVRYPKPPRQNVAENGVDDGGYPPNIPGDVGPDLGEYEGGEIGFEDGEFDPGTGDDNLPVNAQIPMPANTTISTYSASNLYGGRLFAIVSEIGDPGFNLNLNIKTYEFDVDDTTYDNPLLKATTNTQNYNLQNFFDAAIYPNLTKSFKSAIADSETYDVSYASAYKTCMWALKDRLYVLILPYTNYDGVSGAAYFHETSLVILDINSANGSLSNPRLSSSRFVSSFSQIDKPYIVPFPGGETAVRASQARPESAVRNVTATPVVLDNQVLFNEVDAHRTDILVHNLYGQFPMYDFTVYDISTPEFLIAEAYYPSLVGDFDDPENPIFRNSGIPQARVVEYRQSFEFAFLAYCHNLGPYGYQSMNMWYAANRQWGFFTTYVHDEVNKKVYAFSSCSNEFYRNLVFADQDEDYDITYWTGVRSPHIKVNFTKEQYQKLYGNNVFVLDYGKGETTFSKFGSRRDWYRDENETVRSGILSYGIPSGTDSVFVPRAGGYETEEYLLESDSVAGGATRKAPYITYGAPASYGLSQPIHNNASNAAPLMLRPNLWVFDGSRPGEYDYRTANFFSHSYSFRESPYNKGEVIWQADGNSLTTVSGELYAASFEEPNGNIGLPKNYYSFPIFRKISGTRKFVWTSSKDGAYVAVDTAGDIWAWGANASVLTAGEVSLTPKKITNSGKFKMISLGIDFAVALDNEGKAWTWGNNSGYRTSLNVATGTTVVPTKTGETVFEFITAGAGFWAGMTKTSRDVWIGGTLHNNLGQSPIKIIDGPVRSIAALRGTLGVITANGEFWGIGNNENYVGTSVAGPLDSSFPYSKLYDGKRFTRIVGVYNPSNSIGFTLLTDESEVYGTGVKMTLYSNPNPSIFKHVGTGWQYIYALRTPAAGKNARSIQSSWSQLVWGNYVPVTLSENLIYEVFGQWPWNQGSIEGGAPAGTGFGGGRPLG